MESNFILNCTSFTLEQLKMLNISRGVSGIICSLIAASMLLLLVYNKSYKSVLQRLFLYLTTTTLLLEAFLAIQIERQFHYPGQFCSALGFLIQVSGGMIYMFSLVITILLLYTVYKKLRGKPVHTISGTNCSRAFLEILLVVSVIIITLSYHWVPFVHKSFGLAGAYCWIKGINNNCTGVAFNDQLAYYIVAETIGGVSVLALFILAIVYCAMACRYKTVRKQQVKLVRQNLILMCFLSTHVVILTVGFVSRYIAASTGTAENYTLWFLNAAGIPVSLLVIPTGFLVYLYSIRAHISCRGCKNIVRGAYKMCGRQDLMDNPTESDLLNTNPSSHPVEYPSHTYWSTPYTGEFTTISDAIEMHKE